MGEEGCLKQQVPVETSGCLCCAEGLQWPHPAGLRAERQKPPSVHHHHHYAPPAPMQAAAPGSPVAYSTWPLVVSATALPPVASFLPTMRHVAAPSAAALNT